MFIVLSSTRLYQSDSRHFDR